MADFYFLLIKSSAIYSNSSLYSPGYDVGFSAISIILPEDAGIIGDVLIQTD
ncbi:MAG: hypothetical protein WCS03_07380 [Bacteroidota bacterium]